MGGSDSLADQKRPLDLEALDFNLANSHVSGPTYGLLAGILHQTGMHISNCYLAFLRSRTGQNANVTDNAKSWFS